MARLCNDAFCFFAFIFGLIESMYIPTNLKLAYDGQLNNKGPCNNLGQQ